MKTLKTLMAGAMTLMTLLGANAAERGFAIVIDPATYSNAAKEVEAYAQSLREDGLYPVLLKENVDTPEKIRQQLLSLYNSKETPLEGAVFIGEIPVVMVRDAQHLTSAFKKNQAEYPWIESSVPSDRYYDDFDLKFDFLRKDDAEPLLYYYSLNPESPQYLSPDIYTGRIKGIEGTGKDSYQQIRDYLTKVVELRKENNILDQLLFFAGHGFVSESIVARIDEKAAHLQNFPWMNGRRQSIEYIDHSRDKYVKGRLMNELQRRDLDVALLHHHGMPETEYLNNDPDPETPTEMVHVMKDYANYVYHRHRGKGVPDDTIKKNVARNLGGLPLDWFVDEESEEHRKHDSIMERKLNLYMEDFADFTPNCRVVLLDACFNGSFHLPRYIAASYIFDEGKTAATIANSVNVLQDKWSDRYLGLLGLGMRVGNLPRYNTYLESHCIGDPAFRFQSAIDGLDADEMLRQPASWWEGQLDSEYPAVRVMAMRQLADNDLIDSARLLDIYTNDPSGVVRMEAMTLLADFGDENYVKCLEMVPDDGYEMVQRYGLTHIAKRGDNVLVPGLVNVAKRNNTGKRIEFGVSQAAALYPPDTLIAQLERSFDPLDYSEGEKVKGYIAHALGKYANSSVLDDIEVICHNDTASVKAKKKAIRSLRNATMHYKVDDLLEYVQRSKNDEVTVDLLEALGWFRNSYRRPEISKVALQMSKEKKRSKAVRAEALRTYNRLNDGRPGRRNNR